MRRIQSSQLLLTLFVPLLILYSLLQLLSFNASASSQEKRYALVIGNGGYSGAPLKNPPNDAKDMSNALSKLNFSVTTLIDASQIEMRRAIRKFGRDLKTGGVGLFYYAGHGMQVNGVNYLIPVDADIEEEDEVQDYGVDAGMVLRKMQTAENRLNMVFLDACRNNPFKRSFRNANRGLAQLDAPSGSMISYATGPGKTAADGKGRNGTFTKHLLRELNQNEPVELAQLMKKVGKGVQDETSKQQVPWIASSITGDFYFLGQQQFAGIEHTRPIPRQETAPRSQLDAEEEFWKAIANSKLKQDYQDYLKTYPDGRFKPIAKVRLRQLQTDELYPVEGSYRVNGTNPDGSRYTGEVKIWKEEGAYKIRWKIAQDTYTGKGQKSGKTLSIDWGAAYPVIYTITKSGVLEGTWDGGKASETLTPMR